MLRQARLSAALSSGCRKNVAQSLVGLQSLHDRQAAVPSPPRALRSFHSTHAPRRSDEDVAISHAITTNIHVHVPSSPFHSIHPSISSPPSRSIPANRSIFEKISIYDEFSRSLQLLDWICFEPCLVLPFVPSFSFQPSHLPCFPPSSLRGATVAFLALFRTTPSHPFAFGCGKLEGTGAILWGLLLHRRMDGRRGGRFYGEE